MIRWNWKGFGSRWSWLYQSIIPELLQLNQGNQQKIWSRDRQISRGSIVVEALCCKEECDGFNSRWGHLTFLIYLILPGALGPRVSSAPNWNEYQKQKKIFLGSKARPCLRLKASPPSLSRLPRQCGIFGISQLYRPLRSVTDTEVIFLVDQCGDQIPDLSSERAPLRDNTANFRQNQYLVASPTVGSTPRRTDWLTVSRNVSTASRSVELPIHQPLRVCVMNYEYSDENNFTVSKLKKKKSYEFSWALQPRLSSVARVMFCLKIVWRPSVHHSQVHPQELALSPLSSVSVALGYGVGIRITHLGASTAAEPRMPFSPSGPQHTWGRVRNEEWLHNACFIRRRLYICHRKVTSISST
jgi:hypothetical protein